MAGYSGTPLAKKLGIKKGATVLLLGAPVGFEGTLDGMPEGVRITGSGRANGPFDVIVLFTKSEHDLESSFESAAAKLTSAGGLWVSWPKRASGVRTDLDENIVRDIGLAAGLVDNKVCAIDEVWSGLRFVVRVKDR